MYMYINSSFKCISLLISDHKISYIKMYLKEIKLKYATAINGYNYSFENEIQPFLNYADKIAASIESIFSDKYYNSDTKVKLSQQITELAMACHKKEFITRLFNEKFKFISMWFNYIINKELI